MYSPLCMIIEDQGLIAMALEATVEEAGFRAAGPFISNAAAVAWLETHTPDLALVDLLLIDGPSAPVIRSLRKWGVPFAIYSGLKPGARPPGLEAVPWLEKPVSRAELTGVLRDIASEKTRPARAKTSSPEIAELLVA